MLPLESFTTNECPAQFQVDSINLGEQRTLCLTMTDTRGCPLDLSNADAPVVCAQPTLPTGGSGSSSSVLSSESSDSAFLSSASSESQSSQSSAESSQSSSSSSGEPAEPLPEGWTAEYLVREMYWSGVYLRKALTVEDASRGLFTVTFQQNDFRKSGSYGDPGTFLAEVVVRDENGVRRVSEFRYLQVVPTLEWTSHGPITIPEIRMALLDYGCSNTLLDDVEFTDAEIMFAIRRPIDRWNETTPNLILYTPATFPWREHWMICTIGYLMRSAAHKYRRNNLTYQAAGLNVNDMDKFSEYEQVAALRVKEYDDWMRNKKIEINVSQGVGTLGSAYGRYWYARRR
jgi:hypothetical protein